MHSRDFVDQSHIAGEMLDCFPALAGKHDVLPAKNRARDDSATGRKAKKWGRENEPAPKGRGSEFLTYPA